MRRSFYLDLAVINTLLLVALPTLSYSQSKQLDLTGSWVGKGPKFTVDQRGCTLNLATKLTVNGQNLDQNQSYVGTVVQRGNQLIYPDEVIAYPGGSYKQHTQGHISGNQVETISSSNTPIGKLTLTSVGTVSADGNTITGEMTCHTTAGPAIAKGVFTSSKKVP